jgi:hypothetical protein
MTSACVAGFGRLCCRSEGRAQEKRIDSLPASTTWRWCVRRSSSAVVNIKLYEEIILVLGEFAIEEM